MILYWLTYLYLTTSNIRALEMSKVEVLHSRLEPIRLCFRFMPNSGQIVRKSLKNVVSWGHSRTAKDLVWYLAMMWQWIRLSPFRTELQVSKDSPSADSSKAQKDSIEAFKPPADRTAIAVASYSNQTFFHSLTWHYNDTCPCESMKIRLVVYLRQRFVRSKRTCYRQAAMQS